jgi:hypothetical protein
MAELESSPLPRREHGVGQYALAKFFSKVIHVTFQERNQRTLTLQ